MTIKQVYEKYKHLDHLFLKNYGDFKLSILADLWEAVKAQATEEEREAECKKDPE